MNTVRDLKNDPTWQLAGRIAERVYVELGGSVPALQRAIDKALMLGRETNGPIITFNNRTLKRRRT